jgi:hypothetical protein
MFIKRLTALVCFLAATANIHADTADNIIAGIDQRIDQIFKAEAGKPLKRAEKRPPLAEGRAPYVRAYSYSMVSFAARCFYLGEQLEEANASLVENADYYMETPDAILDRDSFHWHGEIVLRLIEMYGPNGSAHPGRLTKETVTAVLKPIWIYASELSTFEKAEYKKCKTWNIYSSENHHVMDFTIHWHFSKLAKDHPDYKDREYAGGGTANEHYQAWSRYFIEYCRERARKGMFVEMQNSGYNSALLKGIYNFYDFGDQKVKHAARNLLDLYFCYWAQEQLNGVQGGGRSRVYFDKGLKAQRGDGTGQKLWAYFGMREMPDYAGHMADFMLSGYRPPAIAADLALDIEGRGRYEVRQRPQGLGKQGNTQAQMTADKDPSRLRTDGGGIIRYSYCDPAFIMGTPMVEARPLEDWTYISAQNRWQGLIFAGDDDARIVPIVRPENSWRALNAQWSVQDKGCLITQKLKTHKGGGEMLAWFSIEGLSRPVDKDGVAFVEAEGAYAAIRTADSNYEWKTTSFVTKSKANTRKVRDGIMFVPNKEYAPIILEVMAKTDVKDFEAFQDRVLKNKPEVKDSVLSYTSIYGDTFTFDLSQKVSPTINGAPVQYNAGKAFESPFLNAEYNSGVVTITKGQRKLVLDFNED